MRAQRLEPSNLKVRGKPSAAADAAARPAPLLVGGGAIAAELDLLDVADERVFDQKLGLGQAVGDAACVLRTAAEGSSAERVLSG